MDVERRVERVDHELRTEGAAERAEFEKRYLKSALEHYGVRVPVVRAIVRRGLRDAPVNSADEVVSVAEALWRVPVHERRVAAAELLAAEVGRLGPGDVPIVERLLRQSRTWALVDVLAPRVMGRMVVTFPELGDVLDCWAADDDFWVRRAALLTLLLPLRRGEGDFERFTRYADSMLDDPEFFVRKAIGWVLRDTGKKRPDLVFDWVLRRADRMPAVALREAVKPLSEERRAAIEGVRSGQECGRHFFDGVHRSGFVVNAFRVDTDEGAVAGRRQGCRVNDRCHMIMWFSRGSSDKICGNVTHASFV